MTLEVTMQMNDQQETVAPETAEIYSGVSADATDTADQETQQTEDTQQEQTEPEQAQPTDAEKALKATQRRIDRLTKQRYRTEAENEQLRAEIARRDAASQQSQQDQPQQRAPTMDDVQRHAEQIVKDREFNKKCDDVVTAGAKEFPRFTDAVKELAQEVPLFSTKGPLPIMEAILEADHPHRVLNHLAENPDLAAELAELSPLKQARRIGLIEREMDAAPKASAAPKPLTPVRTSAAPGEPSPDDTEAWIAYRNKTAQRR